MKRIIVSALAIALALPAARAVAERCASGCTAAKQTCQFAAAAAFRTCRQDARKLAGHAARHAAATDCRAAFHAAQQACVRGLRQCLHGCNVPPPGSCARQCAHEGMTCVQGVVAAAHSCAHACPPGPTKPTCLAACGTQARAGFETCKATVTACLAGCAGSPSGAFLDPIRD